MMGLIETPSREAGARGPEPLSPLDSHDAWVLGLLVLAFLGSRLLWLAWNPGSSIHWEESHRLVAARELLSTPRQPLPHYQADHNRGLPATTAVLLRGFEAYQAGFTACWW